MKKVDKNIGGVMIILKNKEGKFLLLQREDDQS